MWDDRNGGNERDVYSGAHDRKLPGVWWSGGLCVCDMFRMWCQGILDGDMADNLAIVMFARRYNVKLLAWQPPLPDAFAQCKRKKEVVHPRATPFLDDGPQRRTNAYLLQFITGVQHFEHVLPIKGESHAPHIFIVAYRAREGYDPVLNINYRSSSMIAKVTSLV